MLILFLALTSSSLYAQYTLVGNAVQTGVRTYQLTQNANWQNGSVWNTTKIDLTSSFDIFFEVYLGNHDDGADGIAFTLQPVSTNAGAPGLGLGSGGISPSVIVEYDTYQNGFDPAFDHIAIEKNGDVDHNTANKLAGPISATAAATDIEDGQWHSSRVIWNATTKTIEVYFDCNLRLSYSGDIIATIFGGNPNVYYGFTAATGGSINEQSVRDFHFINTKKITTTICDGDNFQVDLSGDVVYEWSPTTNISDSTSATPTFTPTVSTQYIVNITNKCQDKWKDTVMINVNPKPIVNLGPDKTICANGPAITFDAENPGSTYLWSSSETSQTITKSDSGTYIVTVTSNNCNAKDTVIINISNSFTVSLGPDKEICAGDAALTFDSNISGAANYLWNSGEQTQSISKDAAGTYIVEVTMPGGCVGKDTVVLSVNSLPLISLADTNICQGQTLTFDAGIFNSYLWNDNSILQTLTASSTGNYWVEVSNAKGCKKRDTAMLTVNALPLVNLGPDTTMCEGSLLKVISNKIAASYLWNTGATSASIAVSISGKYFVNITDTNNCPGYDEVNINSNPTPFFDLGPDIEICGGAPITIDSKLSGVKLLWSTGENIKTAIDISTSDTITLEAFYDSQCKAYDTVLTTVIPMPSSAPLADTTVCFIEAPSFTINTGNGAQHYLWENGDSTSSRVISAEGNYSLTLTNGKSCSISDKMKVEEKCITSIYVPTAFTPNEDGVNDLFYVKGLYLTDYHLMIFNRWGELLFESYDMEKGWDGTYRGNPVQIDIYVWKLAVNPIKSSVTILNYKNYGHITVIK